MATYSISAPDGNTYTIDGPDGASQQQVQAEVLRQHPTAGGEKSPAPAQQQGPAGAPDTGLGAGLYGYAVEPSLKFLSSMIAKPAGDIAGLAATGYDAVTGNKNNSDAAGFKQYVQDQLTYQPRTAVGQGITNAAGSVLGAAMRPISDYTNWAGNFYANAAQAVGAPQSVVDAVKNGETEAAGQALNFAGAEIPGAAAGATRAAAGAALRKLESTADPALQKAVAEAQGVAPGMQTVAQTTGRPAIKYLGAQAAGSETAQASKQIVDSLTQGLLDQAKKIAPLPLKTPDAAPAVARALEKGDATIAAHQDRVFTAGRKAVSAQPGEIAPENIIAEFDKMKAEAANPRTLSPPALPPRLEDFVDSLRGGSQSAPSTAAGGMTGVQPQMGGIASPGLSWGEFFDVRKQLNSLYKTIPKEQITSALDETFARLKSAYYRDLDTAPASEAKRLTQKTFGIYESLAQKRQTLNNSVVSSILGKEGANAVANPDGVLDRLTKMPPAAQTYAREMLERYAPPDVLDSLRAYAIDKHVQAAGRGTHDPTISATAPSKLKPSEMEGRALFAPAQLDELDKRQSALNVAVGALAEKGPTAGTHIDPQAAGRIVFGGFNKTFVGGAATKLLTAGKLEKYLNTPEGRNALLAPPKAGATATPTRLFIASVLSRVAAERQAQQKQAAQQPPPGALP